MTDEDTDPASAADPGDVNVCGGGPGRGCGRYRAVLGELARRLGRVEEHLAEFHRRAAHRESVIDRLHEENQRLRDGVEPARPGAGGDRPDPAARPADREARRPTPTARTAAAAGRSPTTSRRSWTGAASRSSRPSPAIPSTATGTARWRGGLPRTNPGTTRWPRSSPPGSPSARPAGLGARCRRASTGTPRHAARSDLTQRNHSEVTWLPTESTSAPRTPASRTSTTRAGRSC